MSGILLLILRLILVIALYIFVGWVLFTLWRDLRKQSMSIEKRKIPQIGLYPQAEANLTPVTFTAAEITVGREPTSDFILTDPTISSRHARMIYRQDQWWVEDLKSTNGTFLNDHMLDVPTVIAHGDRLQFGRIEFLVTIDLLNVPESQNL